MTIIVTEKPYYSIWRVWHGETLYDAMPQLIDPNSGDPYDITNVDIEVFARPSLNHATRFVRLSSIGSDGVLKETASLGLWAVFYSQANVEANLPLSSGSSHWEHFIRFSFTDPDLGAVKKLFSYGPMFVFPARDAATP